MIPGGKPGSKDIYPSISANRIFDGQRWNGRPDRGNQAMKEAMETRV
jgi:hypothetical protein